MLWGINLTAHSNAHATKRVDADLLPLSLKDVRAWITVNHDAIPACAQGKKKNHTCGILKSFDFQKRAIQRAQLWIRGSFLCLQRRTSLCSFSQMNRDSNLERRNISRQVSAHFINHLSLQRYPHCVPKGAALIKDPVCCQRKTEGKQTEFKMLGCPL